MNKLKPKIQNKNFFKAIIFDLDGTLLDTVDDISDSANSVLKRYNFSTYTPAQYKLFVGDGMETLVSRLLPKNKKNNKQLIKKIVSEIKVEYAKNWNKKTKIYPGIKSLLSTLSKKGIKMCVLSNKPEKFTKLMVQHFFPKTKFEFVFGARDGVPKKPDPALALKIVKNLNLFPSEFIYLGDTKTDMQTATNAGMVAVGVLWGFRTKKELIKSGAKFVVRYPREVLNFFL
jgi:phosphoglycolate phosphatase